MLDSFISRTEGAFALHGEDCKEFNGKFYHPISLAIDFAGNAQANKDGRWVSLGSDKTRERLFLDENSSLIKPYIDMLKIECKGKSVIHSLQIINKMMDQLTYLPFPKEKKKRSSIII